MAMRDNRPVDAVIMVCGCYSWINTIYFVGDCITEGKKEKAEGKKSKTFRTPGNES